MRLLDRLAELLWPSRCPFCKQLLDPGAEDALCKACAGEYGSRQGSQRTGDWFSGCLWVLAYEGAVRQAILEYKFQAKRCYARAFGRLLGAAIQARGWEYDCLSWVPVSRARLRQRGYDQAELLCRSAGDYLGVVPVGLLAKEQNNPAQSTLENAEARRANVKDVYSVPDPERVTGKRILLIDDIVTTGSTLSEASRCLLLAGAESVLCAALAGRELQETGGCHAEASRGPGH